MELETVLMESVGKAWFDSVIVEWSTIQHERQEKWHPEKPIIITPDGQGDSKPLIIALHGGNGGCEEFSSHFLDLPQIISAVFAFPPGPIKYSPVCHAWPAQSVQSDSLIFSVLDSMKHISGTDPSKVYLIGYSQGAATAIGISLRHPDLIAGTILFSGFTSESFSDSVLANAHRHGLKFYAVSGGSDAPAFLSSLHMLSTRCNQVGVPFHFEERPGMLHGVPLDIDREVINGWRWLHENQYEGE